jgi:2'-5' RNA ligase
MARLFVAVDMPETVKDTLATVQQTADLRGARWTKRSNWHLTLHFIGNAEIAPVDAALQTVQAAAFPVALQGLGVFPSQGRPRVLWAGLDAPPALFDLHSSVGKALQTTGYQPEARAYHPHITLARFKKAAPGKNYLHHYLDSHTSLSSESFQVAHITLYESTLKSSGAVYTARGRYELS